MTRTTNSSGYSRWPNVVLAAAGAALLLLVLVSPGGAISFVAMTVAGIAIVVAALAVSRRGTRAPTGSGVHPGALVAVLTVIVIGFVIAMVLIVGVH